MPRLIAASTAVFFFMLTSTIPAMTQSADLGIFERNNDIGAVKHPGSAVYSAETQEYTVTGSGANMWFGTDEFHYLWKSIQGDFIARAEFRFVGEGVDPHRKVGWTVRNNFKPGSAHVNASVHGDGLASLQYRRSAGADTEEVKSEDQGPNVIQLERRGDTWILSTATLGQPFKTVELTDMPLRREVFIGLYVCSHNPDVVEKAVFRNVRIVRPAPADLVPYREYLGSHLEVMDVESGHRKILYTSAHSLQAPNWTLDGKTLIYNSHGLLYNYDLATDQISILNTGFANNNNNDHVLSFDGAMLAISHHNAEDDGTSTIYTLPGAGADHPTPITKPGVGASYLHGWSPDGKDLVFTGQRNGKYDIYKVNIKTRMETQLTDTEGLDDGPEYSPDGKYIYFNSTRSGNMQLWRMKHDGKNPQQLTFDPYNNWFPHRPPDNRWIVFISYPPEVDPVDHPFYKHVLLRLMPVGGGEPKVIGYLYGGQGTINVPSWSPDSKRIAFVTNSN